VFDYWIHNVMGWKGWPDARGKITPALLEEHRLADLVESVFVPEFGDDWLDFEVVLNESMRLSEDEGWAPDVSDRQERVEAAFEHACEKLIGSPKQQPKLLPSYHRFRNHLLRMWSAFQEAQAEHDKAERESAERFWAHLRLVRSSRGQAAEAWSIVNADGEREVLSLPACHVVRRPRELGPRFQLAARDLRHPHPERRIHQVDLLVRRPIVERVMHRARPRQLHAKATARRDARDLMLVRPD